MGFIVIIAFLFAVELILKEAVEERGKEGEHTPILQDKLYVTKFHNEGAFLGFLKDKPELLKGISYGIIGVCTLIFILTLGHKGKRAMKLGLGMLLGGAYSNAYDRMKRGYVVDYFGFNVKNDRLRNIVFNISDFCIAIGAVVAASRI
jgi:signal peptidase II